MNAKHGKRESRTSPRLLAAQQRHVKALRLRMAGANYRAIAAELGYSSVAGAHAAVVNLLRETAQEPADELRTLELERLDYLWSVCMRQITAGDASAIDRALRIQVRRAALLGLDAPTKIAPTDASGAPLVVTVVYADPRNPATSAAAP